MIIIITIIFAAFIGAEISLYNRFCRQQKEKERDLTARRDGLKKEEDELKTRREALEKKTSDQFFFYDLTRKIAPCLDKETLFKVFAEEMKASGQVERIGFSDFTDEDDYFRFPLDKESADVLCVKTGSVEVIEYLPHFTRLLTLCLERINLYQKAQQLAIHDFLTGSYNRRYFMLRFTEEFQRAQKFKLNLSFLMIDIDHFKAVNDTYGHLVGDVVLRKVARLIQESIREIDFCARFGGEEFSLILLDTAKAGAIMVGERIRARVAHDKIKAFDEAVAVSVSVGIGCFPENTLHSDFLIETADKALYKAKTSGRNRVCWF